MSDIQHAPNVMPRVTFAESITPRTREVLEHAIQCAINRIEHRAFKHADNDLTPEQWVTLRIAIDATMRETLNEWFHIPE